MSAIRYLGSYSVGGLMPQMVSLLAGVIPRLRGQLAGALRVKGTLQVKIPTLSARVAAVARIAAALALQPPSVKFNVAANASVVALLQAQLTLIADLYAAFGAAGVEAFLYEGTATDAAPKINGALGNGLPGGRGSDQIYALVFATRFPGTFTAMGKVFVK